MIQANHISIGHLALWVNGQRMRYEALYKHKKYKIYAISKEHQ